LTLVGTDGREFSLADRPADEVTVVFFGYTHCPDICPTTMADLAVARRQLPNEVREHVTVVFVSEDPERDTPQALRQWLDQFDSTFIGLLGDAFGPADAAVIYTGGFSPRQYAEDFTRLAAAG